MLKNLKKKKNNKGFTLVELLVVIAIIGVLAVVAVPSLLKNVEKSKVAKLEADYNVIKTAVTSYYVDYNAYPVADATTGKLVEDTLKDYMEPPTKPLGGTYKLQTDKNTDVSKATKVQLHIKGINISEGGLNKLKTDLGNANVTATAAVSGKHADINISLIGTPEANGADMVQQGVNP